MSHACSTARAPGFMQRRTAVKNRTSFSRLAASVPAQSHCVAAQYVEFERANFETGFSHFIGFKG
jgi:hypothetical protein